jgi:hypothetical protein
MNDDIRSDGFDWEDRGYFGVPTTPVDRKLPDDLMTDPWLTWEVAFARAKTGDFGLLPALIPVYHACADPICEYVYGTLLGDAGTAACFEAIIRELESSHSFELTLDFCDALAARGKLADVPILLHAYEGVYTIQDADFIARNISDLLEQEPDIIFDPSLVNSYDQYYTVVMNRYKELTDHFGTNQLLVFKGERFGVVSLAKRMLERLGRTTFEEIWRRKFEASTGIECTNFYQEKELKPLSAAAIVEAFLESPDVEKYEDDVRYFFGHRIPD